MARSTRGAVKWLTWTTVLAAAGAGAYQFTVGNGTWLTTLFGRGPTAELLADDGVAPPRSALSKSELDAVASAWGGSPAAQDAPPVSAENATAPQKDDRYAIYHSTPAELPATEVEAVTRGQEPGSLAAKGDDLADELFADEQETAASPSSTRARDAFRETKPIAVDDRYSGSTARSQAGARQRFDARDAGNPFATQPATLPVAEPAAEPIASVEVASNDLRAPRPFAQPAAEPSEARSAASPDRPAGTTYGGASHDFDLNEPQPLDGPADPSLGRRPYALPGDPSLSTVGGTGRPGERSLEGPQKPALVIQKFAPAEIQVGKPAKFAVHVRNVGGQTADDVVIRDEVPQGTRLVNTSPRAEVDGSYLVWPLGALSTGEERTVEIELMPTAEGEIGSVASVSYAAQASIKTHCTMPQLAIRMSAPSTVMIGHEQRVKIELRNPGTGDATDVMLLENVPQNMRHAAGPSLEFEIGTLRAGETRELELVLVAEKSGLVVNTLSARAEGNLQVQQQIEFEVIAPELMVGVEGPERRYLERPATYQVSVENPGTAPAHDVELVTRLPKGMQFVRANNLGEYDAGSHAVYWSLAELPEGERGTVELVAMPVEPGEQTLTVEGKAQQGLADEVKRDVLVEGLAAIMFEVRDTEDPIEVGRETAYEIRVVNQGTKAASDVQVVVSVPPGMQVVSAHGETGHSVTAGGVVFERLAQLAPKADSIYRVQVKGLQPGDQRINVQLSTDDISQPIRREESTRVFGDE